MSELALPKSPVDFIADRTLSILSENGITKRDDRYDREIIVGDVLCRWEYSDRVSILVPDSGYILALSFMNTHPGSYAGEILDNDGQLVTRINLDNLESFAKYLLSVLWD